jgi:hypothetical protein
MRLDYSATKIIQIFIVKIPTDSVILQLVIRVRFSTYIRIFGQKAYSMQR